MEYYDYDQEVCIVNGAGVKNLESKKYVPLYELDRSENLFNYLTSLYIPKSSKKMYNTVHDLESNNEYFKRREWMRLGIKNRRMNL